MDKREKLESRTKFLDTLEESIGANKQVLESSSRNNATQTKKPRKNIGPIQVFILSAMLFIIFLIIGFLVLLIAGKMVPII